MVEELRNAVGGAIESPSALVQLGLGLVLLLFGRRLFWLVIALLGFAVGLYVAGAYLEVEPAWRLVVGLGLGLLGAFGAVFLQRVAITIGGSLVAGYATWWYLSLGSQGLATWQWLLVAGAALLGLMVARLVADVALVGVSCVAGATLTLQALGVETTTGRWLFFALLVVGAAVQVSSLRSKDGSDD